MKCQKRIRGEHEIRANSDARERQSPDWRMEGSQSGDWRSRAFQSIRLAPVNAVCECRREDRAQPRPIIGNVANASRKKRNVYWAEDSVRIIS
jgi:hypothetical protein